MSRAAAWSLGLWLALGPAAAALADGEKGVRPDRPVAEILAREPGAGGSGAAAPGADSGRSGAIWTGAIVVAAAGIALLRRRRSRAAAGAPDGSVEIVGRAALSHRHSVCVIRVGEARIVIGLAGDRMSSLAVLEDDAAPDRAPAERTGRPPLPEIPRGRLDPGELDRYRRQVDRLKDLLRGPLRGAAREMGGAR